MRVLLYEFFSSGGLYSWKHPLPDGLLAEGAAMLAALAADFARLPGIEPLVPLDIRFLDPAGTEPRLRTGPLANGAPNPFRPVLLPGEAEEQRKYTPPLAGCSLLPVDSAEEEERVLRRHPRGCARVVQIAPEIDLHIPRTINRLTIPGKRKLLWPHAQLLLGCKELNRERLEAAGVPGPRSHRLGPQTAPLPEDFPFPAVSKPSLGCGGLGVRRWDSRAALLARPWEEPALLEAFLEGMPASIGAILTAEEPVLFPVCRQEIVWRHGAPEYLGGEVLAEENLQARAERLARAALASMRTPVPRRIGDWYPGAGAFVGLDLLLGANPDGDDDVVLEINPRLTTSYLGLRHAVRENPAEVMLQAAAGERVAIAPLGRALRFTPAGDLHFDG